MHCAFKINFSSTVIVDIRPFVFMKGPVKKSFHALAIFEIFIKEQSDLVVVPFLMLQCQPGQARVVHTAHSRLDKAICIHNVPRRNKEPLK